MKNRKRIVLLVMALLLSCTVTGCQDKKLENEKTYRQIGINAMEKGDYDGAIAAFQQALDCSVGRVRNLEIDICFLKAEAQFLSGDIDAAIETCDAVIYYDDRIADAYNLRGNLHLQNGDTQKALDDYAKAVSVAKRDYKVYIQIYENLMNADMVDAANEYLNMALEIKGEGIEADTNKGYIYYLLGDYTKAEELLLRAVGALEKEEEPDLNNKSALYLAQIYDETDSKEEAKIYYEKYKQNHADDPLVLCELGDVFLEQQDYEHALEYYQAGLKVVESETIKKRLRKGEIIALEFTGDFKKAKEQMATYVLDYPDEEDAKREQIFLENR